MRIKPQYHIDYYEDDISVVEHLPDGTERFVTSLSATAAMVWDGLERGMSREALLDAVSNEFAVDPALVEKDMDALLRQLLALGYAEE